MSGYNHHGSKTPVRSNAPQFRYYDPNSYSVDDSDVTEEVEHLKHSLDDDDDDDDSFDDEAHDRYDHHDDDDDDEHSESMSTNTSSTAGIKGYRRPRGARSRHQRVPGGAAAKLLGKVNDEELPPVASSDGDDEDDAVEVKPLSNELDQIRQNAVNEFSKGPKTNRRYHSSAKTTSEDTEDFQKSPTPSVMDRTEVFHENAQAAVLSLLNPTDTSQGSSRDPRDHHGYNHHHLKGSDSNDFTQGPVPVQARTAFSPPRKGQDDDDDRFSAVSGFSGVSTGSRGKMSNPGSAVQTSELTASGKIQLQQPLLTKKAEEKLERLAQQMVDPSKRLTELMTAIAAPEDGRYTRGYMVRRKNACGALQVLTANKSNRVQICYTIGILPSLTSVLEDGGSRRLEDAFPDRDTRREYVEARKRAVSALMNLSVPKMNRMCVFHSPRLVSSLIRVIQQDQDESRKGCCAVLAQLAKTEENRLLMTQIPGLIDAATGVIEPIPLNRPGKTKIEPSRSMDSHSTDSEEEDDDPNIVESFYSDELPTKSDDESVPGTNDQEEDPIAASRRYDSDPNIHLHGSRQNIFAFLGHVVKEKDNAYHLARHKHLIKVLVAVSKLHDSNSHEHAVRIIANLTRHRGNSKEIVFKLRMIGVVPAIVKATVSMNDETRKYACFALQNLSQDKPCRQELAATEDLLTALCVRIRQAANPEERLSAIHALKNLTDEPANLIPMTNTPECFATLMQIAHASDDSVTEIMQYLGCDALATLSHWFRSIATSGKRIDTMKRGHKPSKDLFVPTLKIVTWQRWQ